MKLSSFALIVVVILALPQAALAYYSPSLGRFISRDPIQEQDGPHIYCFVRNAPVGNIDPDGRFKPSTHELLARDSLNDIHGAAIGFFNANVSQSCWSFFVWDIVKYDLEQDGEHFDELERHYNREFATGAATEDRRYENYITGESQRFHAHLRAKECREARKSLGYLTHSWQDFFAHAIRRDGLGGRENSLYPGWTAFSVGITGTPYSRGNFWPSTYSLWAELEHPRIEEPVDIGSPEGQARAKAARRFVFGEYATYVIDYFKTCPCTCDPME